MKNLALAKKLEGCNVQIPNGFRQKIVALDSSPNVCEYADGVVHNLEAVISAAKKPLNAMLVVGICMTTMSKMMLARFLGTKLLEAYSITPEYLAILIPDERVRHDSITLFNGEMTEIVHAYVRKF